ncbi:glycosyl transferase, group 1 family protein [Cryptosporidium serpentis]
MNCKTAIWNPKIRNTNKLPNICMVSDFFYPGLGGVEMHIYELSRCLIIRGFKVIVVTHSRNNRYGVRYMGNGLKIYYLPHICMHDNVIFPSFFSLLPLFRQILIREEIDIVHGHQAVSMLALECIFHAVTMGYKVVYTDHSLFGLSNFDSIHVNNILKISLSCVDDIICVSYTNKKNLIYRASINPKNITVIPNAIDSSRFTPNLNHRYFGKDSLVVIISICRMTYRKGVDLLASIIPIICNLDSNVNFLIGGDGPKRILLDEMRDNYNLHDRVELLGEIPSSQICSTLQKGHIFLNTSLTEAFCISIVEAASCGLLVVSTNVGGIPEVLPSDILKLAKPSVSSMVNKLINAIDMIRNGEIDPEKLHNRVSRMYSWHDVANMTELVYYNTIQRPCNGLIEILLRIASCGPIIGKVYLILVSANYIFWYILSILYPENQIELAINFPK